MVALGLSTPLEACPKLLKWLGQKLTHLSPKKNEAPVSRLGDAPLDIEGNPLSHRERHEMIQREHERKQNSRNLGGDDFSGFLF